MSWRVLLGFLVAVLGAFTNGAVAAQPTELSGLVVDALGDPVPGAVVRLEASGRPYNVVSARYSPRGWTASGLLRVTGPQFEDDLNAFTLRRATVVEVMASRIVARRLNLFVAIENLFNSEYDVGRTPVLTTGLLRAARAGLHLSLP